MLRIEHNFAAVIAAWQAFAARCQAVPSLVINDPEWQGLALGTAERTLTAGGCPGPLRARILRTLRIVPGVGVSTWSLGRLRGLIQEVAAIVQGMHVNRRVNVAGQPASHHLRQVPLLPRDDEAAAIDNVRNLIREWVLTEKRLDESEHANPEEAVDAIEGILGLRGSSGDSTNREMWGNILAGGKRDANDGLQAALNVPGGWGAAGGMSVAQAEAAAGITRAIGEWLAAGGREQEKWTRAGNDPADAPTPGAFGAMLGAEAADSLGNSKGKSQSSKWGGPLALVPDMGEVDGWLRMVLAAWVGVVLFHLPRLVHKHLVAAAATLKVGSV